MSVADAYTIEHQPITAIDLIERAATAFVEIFTAEFQDFNLPLAILCGPGNNGADGLAIARLLRNRHSRYKQISVYLIDFSAKHNNNYSKNLGRLPKLIKCFTITEPAQLKSLKADLIIDAILGSGLNRPLVGKYAELASQINKLDKKVIAVDVPTGFLSEGIIKDYNGVKADLVICFERPKINFFFPESTLALRRFKVIAIGLNKDFMESQSGGWKLTQLEDIQQLLKPRVNFSHKGTYGHALLVAGNNSTMGAALLASSACLHAGAGLITACIPQSGLMALNVVLPEAMVLPKNQYLELTTLEKFTVVAIGPGLGIDAENEALLAAIIGLRRPLIIDADALTILNKRADLLDQLPAQSILTPHVKEFDRLFGVHQSWWERVETARKQARQRNLIIILKNQYTFVCLPSGDVHINPTGNPAMASGGMGDVLTGIIAALRAQSYEPATAAILAVYLHGKAGDELAEKRFTVSASQVAQQIPKTIKKLLKIE